MGLEILKEGEQKRKEEIERLWRAYDGKGRIKYRNTNHGPRNRENGGEGGGDKEVPEDRKRGFAQPGTRRFEEPEKILEEILALDPHHPGGMLAKGRIIEALKCQDQRGGSMGELGDLKRISSALLALEQQKKGSPLEISYFRAKILLEEGMLGEAGAQLQKVLKLNPQYFPAWVEILTLAEGKKWAALDHSELESLRRKIEIFQMDRVAADAWQWGGVYEGLPSWVAPVRNAHERKKMTIQFSGTTPGLWKLVVDGQFAAAWAGSFRGEPLEFALPGGEHLFRVVGCGDLPPDLNIKLPFHLEVRFGH